MEPLRWYVGDYKCMCACLYVIFPYALWTRISRIRAEQAVHKKSMLVNPRIQKPNTRHFVRVLFTHIILLHVKLIIMEGYVTSHKAHC